VLQCVVVCCSLVQCALRNSCRQGVSDVAHVFVFWFVVVCVAMSAAVCCSVLQCALQCVAVCWVFLGVARVFVS